MKYILMVGAVASAVLIYFVCGWVAQATDPFLGTWTGTYTSTGRVSTVTITRNGSDYLVDEQGSRVGAKRHGNSLKIEQSGDLGYIIYIEADKTLLWGEITFTKVKPK